MLLKIRGQKTFGIRDVAAGLIGILLLAGRPPGSGQAVRHLDETDL
jgi:hypothetical protein